MAASKKVDRYCYVYSCDLHENLQIKIGSLESHHFMRESFTFNTVDAARTPVCNDLTVTCQVFSGKDALTLPVQTCYKSFTNRLNWQEWLTLPIEYSHLPKNAELVFCLWAINRLGDSFLCGQTSTSVFTKYGTVQTGMLDLKVCTDNSTAGEESTGDSSVTKFLAEVTQKHREGRIEKIDWLDRLTFREIEVINENYKRQSKLMYLMVEFPHVFFKDTKFDIVYFEQQGDIPYPIPTKTVTYQIADTCLSMPNLVESKHHVLARTLRSAAFDRDMKPDTETRAKLNDIVSFPLTTALTSEQQDLLWKYRYFLSSQKLALTKFLKCVNWDIEQEKREAIELMHYWEPINVEDSLELLSPNFQEPAVRQYAVSRLMQADDEELLLYLLQLVQAVRYENLDNLKTALQEQAVTTGVTQDVLNDALADEDTEQSLEDDNPAEIDTDLLKTSTNETMHTGEMDIVSFLIYRASTNFTVANYLYWYLKLETEEAQGQNERSKEIFSVMQQRFFHSLKKSSPLFNYKLQSQQQFMDHLLHLIRIVVTERLDRQKKIEKLQSLLKSTADGHFSFTEFEPFPLPLDPSKLVKAVLSDTAYLFKSSLSPARLTFLTTSEEQYTLIFKHGDDLRQDQLILQMVALMDRLLRKENLDLKLKPYRVLATSTKHGFIEFVASQPVAEILNQNDGSILHYLRKQAPSTESFNGVSNEVMDTYVRSCAGYCVITYILGVGDRHLDNLMLTPKGHLFHVDFGYILGRDPKPMPPPMKLTKEMVDAMGGPGAEYYKTFTDLCINAFFHLRRSANLVLNLFSLMVDANIPDIVLEPDKTVQKVQDKFMLDLSDEEAAKEMHSILEVSVSALMPAMIEHLHRFAQYWRK